MSFEEIKEVRKVVIKPISSTRYVLRCQVDLIDFRDMSEEHNMSEPCILYRWPLVYQDYFTKFFRLRHLKKECAEEIADVLEELFCEHGIPHFL